MARKITVIGANRQVTKVVAALFVRRAVAYWVEEQVSIKMRPLREFKPSCTIRIPFEHKPFIPSKLPPAEIGGCHFKGPKPDPESLIPRLIRVTSAQY